MGHLMSKFGVNWNDSNEARPASQTHAVREPAAVQVPRDPGLGSRNQLKRSSTTVKWNGALRIDQYMWCTDIKTLSLSIYKKYVLFSGKTRSRS